MEQVFASIKKHCRWCGKSYMAGRPYDRDGFCSPKCKQAHYRAYKRYVTSKTGTLGAASSKKSHR